MLVSKTGIPSFIACTLIVDSASRLPSHNSKCQSFPNTERLLPTHRLKSSVQATRHEPQLLSKHVPLA